MSTTFSFKAPSSAPTLDFAVCAGPRTFVVGRDVLAKGDVSSVLAVDIGGKPTVTRLEIRAAALRPNMHGMLVAAVDLSMHEGRGTLERLTPPALKQPLVDEFKRFLGSLVAFISNDEAVALVPAKKKFELWRWRRARGWKREGAVPEIEPYDGGGASIAWDAPRERVVVFGVTGKHSGRSLELHGATWKVTPAGKKLDQVCSVLLGGEHVVAIPSGGYPQLITDGANVIPVREGPKLACAGLAGNELRFVSDDAKGWTIESIDLEPYASTKPSKVMKPAATPKTKAKPTPASKTAGVPFTSLQMKLMVIDELTRRRVIPKFKLATVEKSVGKKLYDGANWVMPEDGWFGMQPEVRDWFWALPLERAWLAKIEQLSWGPDASTIAHVAPNWDGEDDLFNVTPADAVDLALLPNLKKVSALYAPKDAKKLQKLFAAKGVELRAYFG